MFKPIDISKAALTQTGCADVVCSEHLWSWKTKTGQNIDLNKAAVQQHGAGHQAVATGVHAYDWAAYKPSEPTNMIQPVMQVAADLFYSVGMVRDGLAKFSSAIESVRGFYQQHLGKSFQVLKPIIQYSNLSIAQWSALQEATKNDLTRYSYLDQAQSTLVNEFKTLNTKMVYLVTQYCGDKPELWLGAANRANVCVVPPRCCSVWMPALGPFDALQRNIIFAIGHELGHAFGLPHPDQAKEDLRPNGWQNSIMQWGFNDLDKALLTSPEKTALKTNAYFTV